MPDDIPSSTIITPFVVPSIPPELDNALKIVQRYAKIYASQSGERPEIVMARLMIVDSTVPLQWNGRANYPYYKDIYAKKVKSIVDLMVADQMNRKLLASDFKVSRNTLHSMMLQGWMYLSERMDDEKGTYAQLRTRIVICKTPTGLMFEWKSSMAASAEALANTGTGVGIDFSPAFKEELLEYLETGADETKYEKTGLKLSVESQEWIREVCDAPNIFIHKLCATSLTIVKSAYASKFRISTEK